MAEVLLEVHPSEVNSALLCEMRLDTELQENRPSYDMLRGSATHYLIERNLLHVEPKLDEFIEERFAEEYEMAVTAVPELTLARLKAEAMNAFIHWDNNVKPHIRTRGVVNIEEELRLDIGEYVFGDDLLYVQLVGSPDCVDASPRIHDWKTGNKVWDPVKLVSQAQPPLYNALKFGLGRPVPFTFWVYEVPSETWFPLSVTPTVAQMEAMINTAFRLAVKRHLGLLTANPGPVGVYGRTRHWHCSPKYCQCWNRCTARNMFNDGNDDVVADWQESWQS